VRLVKDFPSTPPLGIVSAFFVLDPTFYFSFTLAPNGKRHGSDPSGFSSCANQSFDDQKTSQCAAFSSRSTSPQTVNHAEIFPLPLFLRLTECGVPSEIEDLVHAVNSLVPVLLPEIQDGVSPLGATDQGHDGCHHECSSSYLVGAQTR